MSWVVPSIAAEVWGVSLDHVMSQVRAGVVASREEFGFLWVEVTATSQLAPRPVRSRRRGRRSRPQTYTRRPVAPIVPDPPSIGADELEALGEATAPVETEAPNGEPEVFIGRTAIASAGIASVDSPPAEAAGVDPPEPDECESPEDPDDGVPMNWREARSRVATTRRRPPGR